MSDPQCVGVCMFDWDAGVCLGCGRSAEEIERAGAAADEAPAAAPPAPEPSVPDASAPDAPVPEAGEDGGT